MTKDFNTAVDTLMSMFLNYKMGGIDDETFMANLKMYCEFMEQELKK